MHPVAHKAPHVSFFEDRYFKIELAMRRVVVNFYIPVVLVIWVPRKAPDFYLERLVTS